jgi:antagonist of KipI
MIEILDTGLLTTIQDLGRAGLGYLGVPPGGAADPWSLRVANLLAGNAPDAAALEVTAAGPRLRSDESLVVGLAGADLRATVDGVALAPGQSAALPPGAVLHLPGPAAKGLRGYVAIAGRVDVPVVLGSRSTCLPGGFGGLEGRPIRDGDRLRVGRARASGPGAGATWPGLATTASDTDEDGSTLLRCLPGPAGAQLIAGRAWTVSASSDRVGVRLERGDSATTPAEALASHGLVPGAVQVPPDGRPIILGVDHQTTGGYPVAAIVIAADLAAIGQLSPGQTVSFVTVTPEEARRAWMARRLAWRAAVRAVRGDARWDALWQSAGA